LELKIVTCTSDESSKLSPGSTIDFKEVKAMFSERKEIKKNERRKKKKTNKSWFSEEKQTV
jgi:hypothetical protein